MSRAGAAASLIALVLVAPACAPQGASDAEAKEWLDERRADMPADALGSTQGRLGPDDPEPAPDDGVTLTLDEPVDLAEIRLECLGGGTVNFAVHVTMVAETVGQTYSDLPCGADGHGSFYGPAVVSIRVNAFDADRDGAWHAVVLGAD